MKKRGIDKQTLNARIQKELGVNLEDYRNEEITNSLVELLVFPSYIVNWVIRPVVLAFFLFILGYFIIDLVHIEYAIYTILGFVLFIITGFIVGLWLLSSKMKQDICEIIDFALDTMSNVLQDVSNVKSSMNINKKGEVLQLLFSGIIHVTFIPVISSVISKKIKFGGGIIEGFISKILNTVASKMQFDDVNLKELKNSPKNKDIDPTSIKKESTYSVIRSSQHGLNKVLNIAFNIGQFPIKIAAGLSIIATLIFLYLIW